MITYIKGDLIKLAKEGKFDVIAHGCNCFNIMGAGIALQIAENFPEALQADLVTKEGDHFKLGGFSSSFIDYPTKRLYIYNLYTQYSPGKDFRLWALASSLHKMTAHLLGNPRNTVPKSNRLSIGIPKIGAGIGGGNWDNIEEVVRKQLRIFDVTVVEYKATK